MAMAPNFLFLVPTQTEFADGQDFNGSSMIAKLPCLKISDGQMFTFQKVGRCKML
jgi:hypothetical protein